MSVEPGELLQRIAATLKADIGPEVGDEFARTQTFMASVVLDKVAKQLTLAPGHEAAEEADMASLIDQLSPFVVRSGAAPITAAFAAVQTERSIASLGPLVEAFYAEAGDQTESALAAIRPVLRKDIDRRMEIAT